MLGQEQIHGQNHTHLPLLIAALLRTTGPVLEVGMGDASTPNLHALLEGTNRLLVSVDDQKEWSEGRFGCLERKWHQVLHFENWLQFNPVPSEHEPRWSVVLIDHAPSFQREHDVRRLANHADYIVIHDAEPEVQKEYRLDQVLPLFKYKTWDRRYRPWTVCVSNKAQLHVDWLSGDAYEPGWEGEKK